VRIGIGALLGIVGGPATYARELVRALVGVGGHEYVVFTDRPDAFADAAVECVTVPLRGTWHQVLWDHEQLPGLLRRHGVALYHGTKNVLPFRLALPGVVTVHDLAVYACPETFAWPQRWHFRLTVPSSVARAARVICDSAHARGDVLARFGLAPERVAVVPLAVAPGLLVEPPAAAVAALRRRYALGPALVGCIGTIQPRKHVERVIDAFVRAEVACDGWQLVVAGRLRPGHRPDWVDAPPPGVRWLGPLSDEELRALYAACEIVMSASEYEGFGLTILEAMAARCAVVAVATTSIPEVAGDAARLVPRSDAGLLAHELRTLAHDDAGRAALAERAWAHARRFDWAATARGTRDVYDEVLACRRA